MNITQEARACAKNFIEFVNKSPTSWHAVSNLQRILTDKGFSELPREQTVDKNSLRGRKHFIVREGLICAFTVGKLFTENAPLAIIAAHTDSPCLKLKPTSKYSTGNYSQVAVQFYGGGIWHTWFDRDLAVAGIVGARKENEMIIRKLVHLKIPLLRIPSIAIHLSRKQNESFTANRETEMIPVLGLCSGENKSSDSNHDSQLISKVASEISMPPESILDMDLCLVDAADACFGGLHEEFIFAPRMDNLTSCFCAINALVDSTSDEHFMENDDYIRMVLLFDHEEVGSSSETGAETNFINQLLGDVLQLKLFNSVSESILISADAAHAVHPNYPHLYEKNHSPLIDGGPVIKHNCNLRYATSFMPVLFLKEVAKVANVPLQEFVIRNDQLCGSTIGPILAPRLGIRTIDIGLPILSMHSIREMGSTTGISDFLRLLKTFFNDFNTVKKRFDPVF